jgi:hypothetical protein
MKTLFLLSVVLSFVYQPAFAANTKPVKLISYEQLSKLPQAKKVEYLKTVRELVAIVQQAQEDMKYSSNFMDLFLPDAFAGPGECNCGGFFSARSSRGYCVCQWCGDRSAGMVKCNPVLFGEGTCVSKDSGTNGRDISKACGEASDSKIDAIAAKIKAGSADSKAQWEGLRTGFGEYCTGAKARTSECQTITRRITALNGKVGQGVEPIPVPPVVQGGAPSAAPAKPDEKKEDICRKDGTKSVESCVRCPTVAEQVGDLGNTKYAQLLKTAANICGVENNGVKAEITATDLINKLGTCSTSQYPDSNNFKVYTTKTDFKKFPPKETPYLTNDGKVERYVNKMLVGDKKTVQAAEFNNNSEHAKAMLQYYGLLPHEVRQIFCTGKSTTEIVEMLRRRPAFSFARQDIGGSDAASMDSSEHDALVANRGTPITKLPLFATSANNPFKNSSAALVELNDYKRTYYYKRDLAQCLEDNSRTQQSLKQCDLTVKHTTQAVAGGCPNGNGTVHVLSCKARAGAAGTPSSSGEGRTGNP